MLFIRSVYLLLFVSLCFSDVFAKEPISPIPDITLDSSELWGLGRLLYHDRRLSGDNTLACVSCHDLATNGADGVALSVGVGGQLADLNTPTVFNAIYNFRQFWDGRASSLTEQVSGPIHNPKEMASNWPDIIQKLSLDAQFTLRFEKVFGRAIDQEGLIAAIAAFGASLTTPNAPFDRYLRGDMEAVSSDVIKGYQLFKEYGCVSCHQGVNIGGNMYQKLGVFENYFSGLEEVKPRDYGRFNVTQKEVDRFVFKVPSLRNVAITAPYFHNGQVETLESAVRLMALYQLGIDMQDSEVNRIVSFLQALTGEHLNKKRY